MSDYESIKRLKEIIEETHEDVLARLFYKARKRGFSSFSADDVVQEAFNHILTQIENGNLNWVLDKENPGGTLKKLILGVSFKEGVKQIGKKEWAEDILTSDVDIKKDPEKLFLDLDRAIDQLNEEDQEIINMFYREKYKLKEIASTLGYTIDAMKQRIYRIRTKLKEELS